MAKIPSFPLYAQDFDMDTNTWTNEEVGVYLRLLLSEWINGPLPDDTKKLAQICRISRKKFKNLFQICSTKFIRDGNGFLINKRMEKEREKYAKYRDKKVKAGMVGAKNRWKSDSTCHNTCSAPAITRAVAEPMAFTINTQVTNTSNNNILTNPPPISPPFFGGGALSQKRNFKKETQKVLDYINKRFNRKFSDGRQITARLRQGGTVAQCKQIIDTKSHDPHFQANPHLFSPATLFRPSHWDAYLNQKPSDFKRDGPEPVIVPYKQPELPKEDERVSPEEIRETLKTLKKGGLRQ